MTFAQMAPNSDFLHNVTAGAAGASAAPSAGVTDNDKIKVQLYVDVCHFAEKLRGEIFVNDPDSVPHPVRLLEEAVASAAGATLRTEVTTDS